MYRCSPNDNPYIDRYWAAEDPKSAKALQITRWLFLTYFFVVVLKSPKSHNSGQPKVQTPDLLQRKPLRTYTMGGVSTLTDAQSYEIEQYCAHRPEYPASLWALFTTYHHGPLRIAHDIGTGYGNGIEGLLRSLKLGGNSLTHAILTEPKSFLLDAARIRLPPLFPHTTFAYRNKKGEGAWDSPLGIATGQLDLVMSCEAIHWTILTPTLAHINQSLRPGGTFGAVVYAPLPNVVDNAPATASLRRVVELHVSRLVSEDWMDEGWKRCMVCCLSPESITSFGLTELGPETIILGSGQFAVGR